MLIEREKRTSPVHRGSTGTAAAGSASRRTKGAKRDPKVLAALVEKLGAFIRKTLGQRIEQIGKALGPPAEDPRSGQEAPRREEELDEGPRASDDVLPILSPLTPHQSMPPL